MWCLLKMKPDYSIKMILNGILRQMLVLSRIAARGLCVLVGGSRMPGKKCLRTCHSQKFVLQCTGRIFQFQVGKIQTFCFCGTDRNKWDRLTPANTIPFCGVVFCICQHTVGCCRHVSPWLLWDLRCSLMSYLARKAGCGCVAEFVRCQQLLPSVTLPGSILLKRVI